MEESMRSRILVLGGVFGLSAIMLSAQACGETEPAAVVESDSGADVDDSGQADVVTADEDAATCDLSADFTADIPDADIADGASTSGLCLQCAHRVCEAPIASCNANCTCQGLAGGALECFLHNADNPVVCAGDFMGVDDETRNLGFALVMCIDAHCKSECATTSFQDAGTEDADADSGE